ncbi:MAG: hypothetical protein ACRD3C_25345 [Vicinamibacterales bacterium]
MSKIAITIPDAQMRVLERVRRKHRLPRSRVVQQALSFYFAQAGLSEEVSAYEEGYRRKPERTADVEGYARAAADVLGREDWA